MKLTKEDIEKIKALTIAGKKQIEIAKEMDLPPTTVGYWANETTRENTKKRARKNSKIKWDNLTEEEHEIKRLKRRKYMRKYIIHRYRTDKEFCEKQKARMRDYQKRMWKLHGNKRINQKIKTKE